MARRDRPIDVGLVLFLVLFLLFCSLIVWRIWSGRRKPGYLALIEYWVYSDVQRLPPTAALMDAAVSKNPHNRPNNPSITAREGILFSDLRLHLGIARREKNPHAFRPDLFNDHTLPNADVLHRLSSSSTLSKVQYASQVPLVDGRHLQFVTHLADTLARLTRGKLIFDTVTEQFWLPDQLFAALQASNDAERPDLHLRVIWESRDDGCRAITLGLRKIGIPELQTSLQEPDEEVIVVALLERVARILFVDRAKQLPIEVSQHGDRFVVSEGARKEGRIEVKIVRRVEF